MNYPIFAAIAIFLFTGCISGNSETEKSSLPPNYAIIDHHEPLRLIDANFNGFLHVKFQRKGFYYNSESGSIISQEDSVFHMTLNSELDIIESRSKAIGKGMLDRNTEQGDTHTLDKINPEDHSLWNDSYEWTGAERSTSIEGRTVVLGGILDNESTYGTALLFYDSDNLVDVNYFIREDEIFLSGNLVSIGGNIFATIDRNATTLEGSPNASSIIKVGPDTWEYTIFEFLHYKSTQNPPTKIIGLGDSIYVISEISGDYFINETPFTTTNGPDIVLHKLGD